MTLEAAPKGARLIVCGGRTYADRARLFEVLDLLRPTEIAEGEAAGADSLARAWAEARNIHCARFPALWRLEGRSAGPKRNRRMFANFEPDGTVAFPGGTGTRHAYRVACHDLVKRNSWPTGTLAASLAPQGAP